MLRPSVNFILLALAICSPVHAGMIELGIGNSNLYSLGNFNASSSDVEGGVAVAGNLTASHYSINEKNVDAYGSYAMVVGGNLDYRYGAIKNGGFYVGGASTVVNTGLPRAAATSTLPVVFASVSSRVKGLSTSLSGMTATGLASVKYDGMTLTGSGFDTTIFDISGADLASVSYFDFDNLTAAQTLILNVSGTDAIGFDQDGAGLGGFRNYNVLFNFFEATHLNLQSIGLYGSLLAPLATVTGGNGQINGNVVVGDWNSNVQVNANTYFKPVDLPGYSSAVTEPGTLFTLLTGLGLIGFAVRRNAVGKRPVPA